MHVSAPAAFLAAWARLGGSWEQHANPTSARLGLLRYLRDLQVRQVLAWPAHELPLPGLGDALQDTGFTLVAADKQDQRTRLSIGLTGADAGLAATGSLVFAPASGRSWLPALLPILHIVILPSDRLYPDLAAWREAWRQSGREQDAARALIVTGPSISADIEFHRHRGTFGPRFLHLILIESGAGRNAGSQERDAGIDREMI